MRKMTKGMLIVVVDRGGAGAGELPGHGAREAARLPATLRHTRRSLAHGGPKLIYWKHRH